VLTLGFLGLSVGYQALDYYHQHFYDAGLPAVTYNFLRVCFMFYVTWIIYASGHMILNLLVPQSRHAHYSVTESLILGFGTGLGGWHLVMLMLGQLNLYYRNLMIVLCLAVLFGSAALFKNNYRKIALTARAFRAGSLPVYPTITFFLVLLCLIWLLLARGLYPGGNGDYFTHYFYYNLSVISNHGLAPNDVWYHYYYSKGTGLQFLGMLLMDPEGAAVITYCYVTVAAIAVVNLVGRLSPHTLWPAFCGVLFVLYNVLSLTGDSGDFQKMHELSTAMMVLSLWTVCMFEMQPAKWRAPAFVMLAALIVAISIIAQPAAVLLGCFLGVQCGVMLFYRERQKFWFYFCLAALAVAGVCGMFLMNYLVTGLVSDQFLGTTWKYANLEKLNQWGVIPNIIMVMWERDNYDMVAVPWSYAAVSDQLIKFLRYDILKFAVDATLIALVCYAAFKGYARLCRKHLPETPRTVFHIAFMNTARMLVVIALLSLVVGHAQDVSFFRFSSFFLPFMPSNTARNLRWDNLACWTLILIYLMACRLAACIRVCRLR
jgi:hypothetical protein